MSIVSTIYYPDPRRSLARESARCRRSPLPRRSLPVDVVDDRCDPSVFELTRLEPRHSNLWCAPAKADSRRPDQSETRLPRLSRVRFYYGMASKSRAACPRGDFCARRPAKAPRFGAAANKSPLVSILLSNRSDGSRPGSGHYRSSRSL